MLTDANVVLNAAAVKKHAAKEIELVVEESAAMVKMMLKMKNELISIYLLFSIYLTVNLYFYL